MIKRSSLLLMALMPSCVVPAPIFVPIQENDLEGVMFLPIAAMYGGQDPCKVCERF